jgi:hypothetical protein
MSLTVIVSPARRKGGDAFDHILELPDVARPRLLLECCQRIVAEHSWVYVQPWAGATKVTAREKHIPPVKEVEAESPGGSILLERPIGRRNHANVGASYRRIAEQPELVAVEKPQQPDLHRDWHFADFRRETAPRRVPAR